MTADGVALREQTLRQRCRRLGKRCLSCARSKSNTLARARRQRIGPARGVVRRQSAPARRRQCRRGSRARDAARRCAGRSAACAAASRPFPDVSATVSLGQQALLVDETVERGAGDAPGVALVLDEGMHDRERGAAGRLPPARRVPSRVGAFGKCATSARKRPTSISGWMPAVTLRRIFTTYLPSRSRWSWIVRARPRRPS